MTTSSCNQPKMLRNTGGQAGQATKLSDKHQKNFKKVRGLKVNANLTNDSILQTVMDG